MSSTAVADCDSHSPPQAQPGIIRLPAETLVQIVGYMKPSTAACFTLSCKDIYNKLGTTGLEKINKLAAKPILSYPPYRLPPNQNPRGRPHIEREYFFHSISQNLWDVIYCHYRDLLHAPHHPTERNTRDHKKRACNQTENPSRKHTCQGHFNISGVQTFMELHRAGIKTTKQLQQMTTTCNLYRASWSRRVTAIPRIIAGNFLTRTQH